MISLLGPIPLDGEFILSGADLRGFRTAALRLGPPENFDACSDRLAEWEGDGDITSSGPRFVPISPFVGSQT